MLWEREKLYHNAYNFKRMVVQDVVHSSPLWLYRKTGKQKKQDKRNDMKKVKKGN